jgi:hypothetical protein
MIMKHDIKGESGKWLSYATKLTSVLLQGLKKATKT